MLSLWTHCEPFCSWSAFLPASLILPLSSHSFHTHSFPLSFSVLLYPMPFASLPHSQHFLQRATGFTSATSILVKLMAVVAHKAGTQCCDVARCPTAALHNPVWSMCWLDRPVFTQAPGARRDPAAATLRGRLAVHCVTHRRAAVWGKLVLWAAKHPPPPGIFYHCPRVRLYSQSLVWNT